MHMRPGPGLQDAGCGRGASDFSGASSMNPNSQDKGRTHLSASRRCKKSRRVTDRGTEAGYGAQTKASQIWKTRAHTHGGRHVKG